MIREGTAGTNDGDGLAQTINGKHFIHSRDFYHH
jgi:hypothetical protein